MKNATKILSSVPAVISPKSAMPDWEGNIFMTLAMIIAILLIIYLVYVLIRPEKF